MQEGEAREGVHAEVRDLAVFDTNVFVSHFLSPHKKGTIRAAVERIFSGKTIPVYSDAIMAEYNEVLYRPKFDFPHGEIRSLLDLILTKGLFIEPIYTPVYFSDASDKCFYEAAVSSGAWLVTGNKRHYPQESFIVSPREYIERVGM